MTAPAGVRQFASLASLESELGNEIGVSDWIDLEPWRIQLFVDATGCRADFAVPHLLVSMVPVFQQEIFTIGGLRAGLNYGSNGIRFHVGVAEARRVRVAAALNTLKPSGEGMLVGVDYVVRDAKDLVVAEIGNLSLLIPQGVPTS